MGVGGTTASRPGTEVTGGRSLFETAGASAATTTSASNSGASAMAGASAAGGTVSSTSATSSGGLSAITGGTANTPTGGSRSNGGSPNIGGAASGGASNTGGSSFNSSTVSGATGGSATGGVNAGGTRAAGGTNATGGAVPSGGTSSASTGTGSITIWMAGDSTMMNCSSSCPCGWGSQFAGYFNSNVTVENRAVGGRSIQTWLYEKAVTSTIGSDGECTLSSNTYDTRWTTLLSSIKPGDYLMIAFGINDGDKACPRHVGTALFKTLLDTMVKAAKEKGALPVLLTPTDAIVCSGSTVTQNRGFLTETKAAATAGNVPLIDLNQLSMDLYKSLNFCPNDDNYTSTTSALGKFFCDDHTHFESAGAKQIAGLVANALKTQNIGLAAYLK